VLSWNICDKSAILLGVSRVTFSKVMSAFMNHWKTTAAKRNNCRKLTLAERDCGILEKIVLKNLRSTAAQATGQQN
jgi:hypothetical protein